MRRPDWEQRFKAAILEWEGRPFAWGTADCATFAAAIVEAVTGADVLARWRGLYQCHLGARARLKARRVTLADAISEALAPVGGARIDPRAARVGDVGITADHTICVRCPAGFFARDDAGRFRLARPISAWSVG